MRNVALMGRAGSGKDTAAALLAERYGHARVAFADPLKRLALGANPIVAFDSSVPRFVHLRELVDMVGWDAAKRTSPEVRRFLQTLGSEGIRDVIGSDTWIRLAHIAAREAWDAGRFVAITDVRFPNEVAWARRHGFLLVWVDRPGVSDGMHASESAASVKDADAVVFNGGAMKDLGDALAALLSAHTVR